MEIQMLLQCYGIPVPSVAEAGNLEDVIHQARRIGYPVVMKAILEKKQHKSEFGAVLLDLRTDAEVIDAYSKLTERIKQHGLASEWRGVYLQPMLRGGKEVIMGVTYDPSFGPLVMFGMGGIYVENLNDTIFRILPITPGDARTMIESIRSYPLLQGVRGESPVDTDFLEEVLQRLSQLVMDFHCLREIEINPFLASSKRESCVALDVRILIDWSLQY